MTEKTQELKPCPFCGCNRIFVATHEFDERPDYYKVECNECESETGFKLSAPEAIAAWNRRAPQCEKE
ncbi:Lar family restriction alleviation protein [Morganella morganii]|uniref:Lar family restriction alleviation protein n=1 Tax=Morganella morganii TaxID=582 RepID=UPI000BBD0776|nr:restriction endonuclease [Morganella morganii]